MLRQQSAPLKERLVRRFGLQIIAPLENEILQRRGLNEAQGHLRPPPLLCATSCQAVLGGSASGERSDQPVLSPSPLLPAKNLISAKIPEEQKNGRNCKLNRKDPVERDGSVRDDPEILRKLVAEAEEVA